jgi:hypothetical protein
MRVFKYGIYYVFIGVYETALFFKKLFRVKRGGESAQSKIKKITPAGKDQILQKSA